MSSLPPSMKLREVIARLKKIDKQFYLYHNKKHARQFRWVIKREGENKGIFALTAPKGMDMEINRSRLKAIAKRFDIDYDTFMSK